MKEKAKLSNFIPPKNSYVPFRLMNWNLNFC